VRGPSSGGPPLSRPFQMLRRRLGWTVRGDEAVGQAIEAMVIGAVVVGAVGFAIASKAPQPPSQTGATEDLSERTWDAVEALDEMHYPDRKYSNSTLSKLVADAAAGDPDPLKTSLAEFLPEQAQFQVYLNNGHARYALYDERSPPGQAVGVAYPFEPGWSHHYGETDLRVYNANSTNDVTMGHNLMPLFNANLVRDPGETVSGVVEGTQRWTPGFAAASDLEANFTFAGGFDSSVNAEEAFTEEAFTSLVQGDGSRNYPSASVHLECARDNGTAPCYAVDFTGEHSGYAPPSRTESDDEILTGALYVRVENDGPADLGGGTELTVNLPVGLPTTNVTPINNSEFRDIEVEGAEPQPQTVTATLNTTLSEGEGATLTVWVDPEDNRYAYKHVQAYLGGNASSLSNFLAVVEDKESPGYTGGDIRNALISAPRPTGSDDGDDPKGRWGVVLPTPVGETEVDTVRLEMANGQARFTDVAFPGDFDPEYPKSSATDTNNTVEVVDGGSAIEWSGNDSVVAEGYGFVEFQFNITTDGSDTSASPTFPVTDPTAEFKDFQPPPHAIQVEEGLWWREAPPDDQTGNESLDSVTGLPGYAAEVALPTAGDPTDTVTADQRVTFRNTVLEGTTTYHVANLGSTSTDTVTGAFEGSVRDAAMSSNVDVAPQVGDPGGSVDIDIAARDMAMLVSQSTGVNSMDMTTDIYAPWGLLSDDSAHTIDHQISTTAFPYPKVILGSELAGLPGYQGLVLGSSDGTVYGIDGKAGTVITGDTFAIPEATGATESATPTHLANGTDASGDPLIAVGTDGNASSIYALDGALEERWSADKLQGDEKTLAIAADRDVNGDDVSEVALATALTETDNENGRSRLAVYDGAADGDGTTDTLPNWPSEGRIINGSTDQVRLGNVGPRANAGVFADTGLHAASGTVSDKDLNPDNYADDLKNLSTVSSITLEVKQDGLAGYDENGHAVWNYTGRSFTSLETTDAMDLGTADTGREWTGIAATTEPGWAFGFNGSQPVRPVNGWTLAGGTTIEGAAFANSLEGYYILPPETLTLTRDGGTSSGGVANLTDVLGDPPGDTLRTVDTPDGAPFAGAASAAWWAGDNGVIIRSTDYLGTVEHVTGVVDVVETLSTSATDTELDTSLLEGETLDLDNIDFHDAYAVSDTEAWFVGEGVDDTDLDDRAYIVHATDGGDDLEAYEVECRDEDDTLLDDCGLHGIDGSEERLWAVGDHGLVLATDATAASGAVSVTGSSGVNDDGIVPIDLETDESVELENASVEWSPDTRLDYMRSVTRTVASGTTDLWNASDGGSYIENSASNHDSDKGALENATLYVDDYTDNEADASSSTLDGSLTFKIGPFKRTLNPVTADEHFDGSAYGPDTADDVTLPLNFTVHADYGDGTTDQYRVWLKEDGTADAWKKTPAEDWEHPGQLGYDVPDDCLGPADEQCNTYKSVNATGPSDDDYVALAGVSQANKTISEDKNSSSPTTLTKDQAPFVLSGGDDSFEKVWDPWINQTLEDVAVSPDDRDRWVVVGDGPLVARSDDRGDTWTVLPTLALDGEGAQGTLTTVDHTNPSAAYLFGGGSSDVNSLQWVAGGHREFGRASTVDLWSSGTALSDLRLNATDLTFGEYSDVTWVEIQVWDPDADGGDGNWTLLYDGSDATATSSPWKQGNTTSFEFAEESDELTLRFQLQTQPGFSVFSPQLRGSLDIEVNRTDGVNETVTMDLGDQSDLEGGSLEDVDHDADNGVLRLEPVTNPWVKKLGNHDGGDWSSEESVTNGAYPHDAAISPDGDTLFVGTGAIKEGVTGTDTGGNDDSLYAINTTSGRAEDGFEIVDFDEPVRHVEATEDAVFVATASTNDDREDSPTIHRVNRSTGDTEGKGTVESNLEELQLEPMATWGDPPGEEADLGIRAVGWNSDADEPEGVVYGFRSPDLDQMWIENPSVEGDFQVTYDIPSNAFYGAHLVETTIQWEIEDDYGNDIVQTARLLDTFEVGPDGEDPPAVPTYNLEVVAWMEDW